MTPHQIDLVRQVRRAVDDAGLDPGSPVLRRFLAAGAAAPSTAIAGDDVAVEVTGEVHDAMEGGVASGDVDLCARLTAVVADLDRLGELRHHVAGLAEALAPLRPTAAGLAALGADLEAELQRSLPTEAFTEAHAEACHLAWRLVTELLHQRPPPPRRAAVA